jgi:negative regulator of sigma E activity
MVLERKKWKLKANPNLNSATTELNSIRWPQYLPKEQRENRQDANWSKRQANTAVDATR